MYNFFGGVAFKGFDLSFTFNGVAGNKVYNYTKNVSFSKLRLAKNVNTTMDAIADSKESINNATPVTTRYLEKGDYLRLNNLSLSYSLDTRKLKINNWISSLRISSTSRVTLAALSINSNRASL